MVNITKPTTISPTNIIKTTINLKRTIKGKYRLWNQKPNSYINKVGILTPMMCGECNEEVIETNEEQIRLQTKKRMINY